MWKRAAVVGLVGISVLAGGAGRRLHAHGRKPMWTERVQLSIREVYGLSKAACELEGWRREDAPLWVAAIILRESSGYPDAVGDKGKAVGLGQFHEGTWREVWRGMCPPSDRTNSMLSARGVVRYMREGERKCVRRRWSAWFIRLADHHNAGHIHKGSTEYGRSVEGWMLRVRREVDHVESKNVN